MRHFVLAIILSLLCYLGCSEKSPTEEELGNRRINLNGSVENLTIGMDSSAVVNILGNPDYFGGPADIDIDNYTFGYHIDEDGDIEVTFFKDFVVDSKFAVFEVRVRRNYLGTTDKGIGIGSSKEEVLELVGDEIFYNVPKDLCEFNTRFIFSYDELNNVDLIVMTYYKD